MDKIAIEDGLPTVRTVGSFLMCTKGCNQGGSGLKAEDVTIYKEIQRNTNMAMKAIETISDKVFDEELAMQISRQSLRYSDICNEATKQLVTAKEDTYQGSRFADIIIHC